MSRRVYKYVLDLKINQTMQLPKRRKLVLVDCDPGEHDGLPLPALWFEIETYDELETVTFSVYGTGQNIPEPAEHIGSAVCQQFVWHIFQV